MLFKTIKNKIKSVNALLANKDMYTLYKLAKDVPEDGIILDIGTCAGGSTFIMALASKPSVHVYTIDPVLNQSFIDNKKEFGLENKITFINQTSEDAYNSELFKDWQKPFDLIFIDGVHSYEGVRYDFEHFGKLLKLNGYVTFHDVFLYDNTIGQYVTDIINNNKVVPVDFVNSIWTDGRRLGMFVGYIPQKLNE